MPKSSVLSRETSYCGEIFDILDDTTTFDEDMFETNWNYHVYIPSSWDGLAYRIKSNNPADDAVTGSWGENALHRTSNGKALRDIYVKYRTAILVYFELIYTDIVS